MGGAAISEKHCGFVVNLGNATCADVVSLTEQVRQIVLEEGLMTQEQLDRCLNLKDMTQPGHLVEYRKIGAGKSEKTE